jgi:hypothetical protein
VSKAVQANLVALEDDADGALAGTTQTELGVGGHVLRQVLDAPVGLPSACRIDLGRFLTSQDQESSLDIGVVLAWRWTLGTVLEASQALLGEAMAPHEDGTDGQTHLARDGGVGLTVGNAQNDLGTVGGLLGGSTGGHDTLQFSAFGGQQTNASATGSGTGHARRCFRSFRLQPAHLHINSIPTSINRIGY